MPNLRLAKAAAASTAPCRVVPQSSATPRYSRGSGHPDPTRRDRRPGRSGTPSAATSAASSLRVPIVRKRLRERAASRGREPWSPGQPHAAGAGQLRAVPPGPVARDTRHDIKWGGA